MECQSGQMIVKQAQYVNQHNQPQQRQYGGNAYQNIYQNQSQNAGQGWRGNQNSQNNQNYGWRNSQNNMSLPRVNEPSPEKKVDLEQALAHRLISHTAFMNETKANLQNQTTQLNNQVAQLRNLEVQMGQMASLLTERQRGALPSNSEVNPRQKGNEHVKAVTLRSGKEIAALGQSPVIGEGETEEVIQPSQTDKVVGEQPHQKKLGEKETESEGQPHITEPTIPIPYPQHLKKSKLDKQFTKFLEVFKKLHINISFADALEKMPSYVKFMKEILSKKRRLSDFETVNLTEKYSVIL